MKTIFTDDCGNVVKRSRAARPGTLYTVNGQPCELCDDVLLSILLDRAEIADERDETKDTQARLTSLKKLMPGTQKRGRGRPKKDDS